LTERALIFQYTTSATQQARMRIPVGIRADGIARASRAAITRPDGPGTALTSRAGQILQSMSVIESYNSLPETPAAMVKK
jgi:hypothetical protein